MNRFLKRITLFVLSVAALCGCDSLYREDMTDCFGRVAVTVRVSTTVGTDVGSLDGKEAVLYVFDSEGNLLERVETKVGETVILSHPGAGELTVIAWINKDDTYDVRSPESRDDGRVALPADLSPNQSTHSFPTDLFYGEGTVVNASTSLDDEHVVIYAAHSTGQMNVTVRGLKEYAGVDDDDFYIVVGPTGSHVDFYGRPVGWQASHEIGGDFETSGDFVTGSVSLLPSDPALDTPFVTVEIWHRTKGLIYSTDTHTTSGEKIDIVAGRTENVLIDFTAVDPDTGKVVVDVRIVETRWGVRHAWKVFN